MSNSPKLIVFTAPSGAGKTTVVRYLLEHFPQLSFSVSATTRSQRAHEQHGKDYYFLSRDAFENKIAEQAFAEWEEVYSEQFYGTLKSEIERLRSEGKVVLFDIDVKGAQRLKQLYQDDCKVIFVMPPSFEILVERLKSRNTESEESLARRIQKAGIELEFASTFDHILLNNKLDETLKNAEDLVKPWLNP